MGNKSSSSSSLIAKNWQKVNNNVYKNILTSELVKQTIKHFQSHQELDSAFRKYVQRVNLSQLDIVKLLYFTKQNRGTSICTSSSNHQSLNVYIQLVQQNLDSFILKFRNQYIHQKGQGCFCQSIIKAAVFLSQKYSFFKVSSKIIWIDIVQNKKNLKKYRAKMWINEDCSSCDVEQGCSQQQMIVSLKQLLKQKIVKNLLCNHVKHQEFQNKFRYFSTLKSLQQKLNQIHSNGMLTSNVNKHIQNTNKHHQQNESTNVRSFSYNSFYPQKQKYNPNQSFGHSNMNRTISTSTYQKKVIIETSKLPPQIKISNLKNQTYISGYNHEQKVVKKQPNHALTKFFSQTVKNQNMTPVDPFRNSNLTHYKEKVLNFNQPYSYSPLIANNNIKQNIQNSCERNNKTAFIQINFNPQQNKKNVNQSLNNSYKKIEIREFRTDEKATDPTDRTKNQVSSKFQQKQTNSVINSSRKNNCIAPNSLSSTYGASQFPPLKYQKQDFQINNYIKQIPQRQQTQKIQKRHSSKDHLSMKEQQSNNSSKAHSTKNIIICQQQESRLKKQQELNKKYEKYCNKLKKITQDKKVQNQIQSIQNSNIKQQKNLNIQPLSQNPPIRKQSVKMTKSINVSSEMNQSIQNSKQLHNNNKNQNFRNNYLNFVSINQIEQRQSFNFDYVDVKQSKFIRTGSQQYALNYPLKKKQSDGIKHNKQFSENPNKIQQPSQIPKMQKKNVSLNLKDQLSNLLGSDNIKNVNKSYSHKGNPQLFNHQTKQMIDSLSYNKSGINGQVNSVYNESMSNLSVHDEQQENLKKSKREKEIIKKEMQSLLRVTTSNQDDHSIKAKVRHKREIFSELKAQALKILD